MRNFKLFLVTVLLLPGFTISVCGQDLTYPEVSQKAKVMQEVGLTALKVIYHSPLVKERKIWDDLVPYNEVWRAGANENTVFITSTDITVEGKKLAAGTYGLHMIPTAGQWTIIFSNNSSSWGSYFYEESEDALRVNVSAKAIPHQEWLSYSFDNITASSTELTLRWEKIAVPVTMKVDVNKTVFESNKNELRGLAGFSWEGPYQAANYCLQNNFELEQAGKWIDQSIARQENYNNLRVKSGLLKIEGKQAESAQLMDKALSLANENQLNTHGYQLLGQNKVDDAILVFKTNVNKYPKSWNVYDSLAEAQALNGDYKSAIANYEKALASAPEGQKKRISSTIERLKKQ